MTTKQIQFARLYLVDYKIIFKLSPAERAVYLALALYGSKNATHTDSSIKRVCYPSQEKMSALLGCSSGTIRRGISKLKRRAVDGRYLYLVDKDGKEYCPDNELSTPRMLTVKHRMSTSSIYTLSSHAELHDSSHVELDDSSHIELHDSSHVELTESSHVELQRSSHAELQIDTKKKDIKERLIENKDPVERKFILILDYFSKHPLSQWDCSQALKEFRRLRERSKLNVSMELLHIGAYQLEKIDQYKLEKETQDQPKRRFWTRKFWIAGMSQWLMRKNKSVLDARRSAFIGKLKTVIPELEPKPQAVEEDTHTNINEAPISQIQKQDHHNEAEKLVIDLINSVESNDKNKDMWITTLIQFSKSDDFPTTMRDKVNKCLNNQSI